MFAWIGGEFDHAELIEAFDRLDRLDGWLDSWGGSRMEQGKLKNLTSQLIGRFAGAAVQATREAYASATVARFGADIVVPRGIQAEIAVLKGIVAAFVMSKNTRQPIYTKQRDILTQLADVLLEHGPDQLDAGFAADWHDATTDAGRRRAVVDQVASLTDQSAISWHERLVHS
jgi:dGTPase